MAEFRRRLMKRRNLKLVWSLALAFTLPFSGFAKSYSSGGHSYSSHSSSSHSFSSGGGHSFSSGSSRTSSSSSRSSSSGFGSSRSSGGSSTKSFNSGSGKSYSSGSSAPGDRKGYSSGKSYTSGSSSFSKSKDSSSSSGSSGFSFDQPAARARKEQASKSDFAGYKNSKTPPAIAPGASGRDYSGGSSRPVTTYTRTIYTPDYTVIRTRPSRINIYFGNYSYRPWVYYHDPYSSLFWWWLLDRSIDEQAYWAYHHRYDMDPTRYDALMASNQQLQTRVSQLETQQVARDPSYTPPSLSTNQDLMYSDQYVNQSYQNYQNRPTHAGKAAFWVFGVPVAIGFSVFFVWFVFFKRW
jgi:hypothetical protein